MFTVKPTWPDRYTDSGRVLLYYFKAITRLYPGASYPQAKILRTTISQGFRRCYRFPAENIGQDIIFCDGNVDD